MEEAATAAHKHMKIIFDKDELLGGLYPAMSTVSNQKTVASIEGVLIETLEENKVRLSTFDMNKGVRVIIEAKEIAESGSYIINASRLLQIIKVLGVPSAFGITLASP